MFKSKSKKKGFQLDMSPETHVEIEKLQMQTAATGLADVIRHALGTYSYIVDLQASGKTIIIRDADGKEAEFPKVPQRSK
ncbi:hypothetical protein [Burkholderia phage FLC6]|nr:hypothetical protein [Burkholderia phage FLC6]BDD79440.1 hypothetical protein [Burkholderia phage FLC8]